MIPGPPFQSFIPHIAAVADPNRLTEPFRERSARVGAGHA